MALINFIAVTLLLASTHGQDGAINIGGGGGAINIGGGGPGGAVNLGGGTGGGAVNIGGTTGIPNTGVNTGTTNGNGAGTTSGQGNGGIVIGNNDGIVFPDSNSGTDANSNTGTNSNPTNNNNNNNNNNNGGGGFGNLQFPDFGSFGNLGNLGGNIGGGNFNNNNNNGFPGSNSFPDFSTSSNGNTNPNNNNNNNIQNQNSNANGNNINRLPSLNFNFGNNNNGFGAGGNNNNGFGTGSDNNNGFGFPSDFNSGADFTNGDRFTGGSNSNGFPGIDNIQFPPFSNGNRGFRNDGCQAPAVETLPFKVDNSTIPPNVVQDIQNEINNRPDLQLIRQFQSSAQGALVPVQEESTKAFSCPADYRVLTRFVTSQNAECWVLPPPDQDPIVYATCRCAKCRESSAGRSSQTNLCKSQLSSKVVVAFCPLSTPVRIIPLRIQIPTACKCNVVEQVRGYL